MKARALLTGIGIAVLTGFGFAAVRAADGDLPNTGITFECDPGSLTGDDLEKCEKARLKEGKRLFDEETFGGNGRTCRTCHMRSNGTFSPEDAQDRLDDPDDPLFVGDGTDDGVSGVSRILEHATVRIEIPLPSYVTLQHDPSATTVILLRGTPTTMNTPAHENIFMYDGRDRTLEEQALGAVHAHAVNTVEPSALQLELLANFQRKDRRFFSSDALRDFANNGPAPVLPDGNTASERRGRAMFDDVPFTPGSTHGVCALCHSGPMRNTSNRFARPVFGGPPPGGARFFNIGVSELNAMNNPVYTFLVDDGNGTITTVTTPDPGAMLSNPRPPEFPPFLPKSFPANMFKTPTVWGIRHTAPYFHDNSAKTLHDVAAHYASLFSSLGLVTLSEQDQKDIVHFLKLL